MQIKDAKMGSHYGIKKIKSVVVAKKVMPNGRILVLNLVTNNEIELKPDYEVDGEMTKAEAEALLGEHPTVQINKATAEADNAAHKAYQKKKKEKAEAPARAEKVKGELTAEAVAAEAAPEEKTTRTLHAPKNAAGLGKCALIDRCIIEGGHTMEQIVEIVAKELGVTDEAGKKAIKSTAGVRPVHVKKAGYEITKDAAGVITAKKLS